MNDLFQIEIGNIIEALLKRGGFGKEPWEAKEHILRKIYENVLHTFYGIHDAVENWLMRYVQTGKKTARSCQGTESIDGKNPQISYNFIVHPFAGCGRIKTILRECRGENREGTDNPVIPGKTD